MIAQYMKQDDWKKLDVQGRKRLLCTGRSEAAPQGSSFRRRAEQRWGASHRKTQGEGSSRGRASTKTPWWEPARHAQSSNPQPHGRAAHTSGSQRACSHQGVRGALAQAAGAKIRVLQSSSLWLYLPAASELLRRGRSWVTEQRGWGPCCVTSLRRVPLGSRMMMTTATATSRLTPRTHTLDTCTSPPSTPMSWGPFLFLFRSDDMEA